MKGHKAELGQADCGVARALEVVGDWWSLLIVREAFIGAQRFGEFQKSLGLAKNILAARLKKLVEDDVFVLEPDGPTSARQRYVLTEKGEQLHVVIVALWQWGERFCSNSGELTLSIVDSVANKPLALMLPHSQNGRLIGPRDFRLAKRKGAGRGA